jgi:hypothetical protein
MLKEKDTSEKIETIRNLLTLQKVHAGVSIKEYAVNFFEALVKYVEFLVQEVGKGLI